jgi:hypothetical protein
MVTMSQKSSNPKAVKSVSQVLMSDSPYRKLNPDILMVESTEHRPRSDAPVALNGPPSRRILTQREVRAHRIVVLHVARKDMPKVLLACHYNVVQAFPPYRAD